MLRQVHHVISEKQVQQRCCHPFLAALAATFQVRTRSLSLLP